MMNLSFTQIQTQDTYQQIVRRTLELEKRSSDQQGPLGSKIDLSETQPLATWNTLHGVKPAPAAPAANPPPSGQARAQP